MKKKIVHVNLIILLVLQTSVTIAANLSPLSHPYNYTSSNLDTLETHHLNEVAVSAKSKKTVTVGKGGIREMDLPQAITVIDTKLIETQQITSITDLLKNVSGMYIMGNTGGYQEEIASRGTSITSTNTFKNGIRYYGGMKTEMSGLESAEILKGNAALLYGNVAPGGVLNLITKKPRTDFGGTLAMTYGSFDLVKPRFDIYGSLNKRKSIAFRLDGSYEHANSFRKYVHSSTYYINPSILFNISQKTSLLVEGDFTKDSRTPDFGAGIVNYQIADIPRDRFLGVSWGKYNSEQTFLSAKVMHKFNKNIQLSSLTGLREYNTDLFSNARPNTSGSTITSDGEWKRNIQRSGVDDNYFIEQIDLNAAFETGGVAHQVLMGVDLESYNTRTTAYNNVIGYDVINIFDEYDAAIEAVKPTMTKNTLTKAPVVRYGLYVQDLIGFTNYLKLLIGVRYSDMKSSSNVYTYATDKTTNSDARDHAFSPKAGLIFQPSANSSLFASYSNSFSLNTGVDIDGNALAPSIIDQYEIGVKNKFFERKLSLNITAYQIENNNLAQTSLENGNTNTNIKELAGATRGRGLEVDLEYHPLANLDVMGGYSYTKTIYTSSNTYLVGSELRYNPKHTGNLSLNYRFDQGLLKNFQAGFVCSYVGERYAGRSTRVTVANDAYKLIPLESYLQHDVIIGYTLSQWDFKLKLNNITNVMSYNVHDDNSLNPIAPFNFSVNVQYKF